LKIYNFHPSLLPNNKGRWPIFWAIVNGDEHGITCHEVNEKIDGGKIILQKNLGKLPNLNIEQVMDIVMQKTPKVMSEALELINSNSVTVVTNSYPNFYGKTPDKINIDKYWEKVKGNI